MFTGKAYKYGDHVNTDVTIPASYLTSSDPNEYSQCCMVDIDSDFVSNVKDEDIVVAGLNFSCVPSREHASVALETCGVLCMMAVCFARIFYRNSINIGLPILESPQAIEKIRAGDEGSVGVSTGEIRNMTSQQVFHAAAFPPFIDNIIKAAGLINFIKAKEANNE